MANKIKRDKDWVEAKRRCQLNQDDIQKAKELGLNPRKLTKNIPSKSQQWKAPVKYWIRDLYEKQQMKIANRKASKLNKPSKPASQPAPEPILTDADLLFGEDSIPSDHDSLFDKDPTPAHDFLTDDDSLPF